MKLVFLKFFLHSLDFLFLKITVATWSSYKS